MPGKPVPALVVAMEDAFSSIHRMFDWFQCAPILSSFGLLHLSLKHENHWQKRVVCLVVFVWHSVDQNGQSFSIRTIWFYNTILEKTKNKHTTFYSSFDFIDPAEETIAIRANKIIIPTVWARHFWIIWAFSHLCTIRFSLRMWVFWLVFTFVLGLFWFESSVPLLEGYVES